MMKGSSHLPSSGSKVSDVHFKMASPHIPDGEETSFRQNMYWMNQDWLKNQGNYITAQENRATLFFLFFFFLEPHFFL